jgi:hypothetical protein
MPEDKQSLIGPVTRKNLLQILLRTLPGVPGPEIYRLVVDLKGSRTSIDQKIEEAARSLQEASRLINDLEGTLAERAEKLNKLRTEVEKYSQLAEIEESKAKAIVQQFEAALARGRGTERWVSLAINLVAGLIIFALGVLLGPSVSSWLTAR